MVKLLLLILLGLALALFSHKTFLSNEPEYNRDFPRDFSSTPYPNSSDAIQGAKGAAEQSQNLQNRINQEAKRATE